MVCFQFSGDMAKAVAGQSPVEDLPCTVGHPGNELIDVGTLLLGGTPCQMLRDEVQIRE